MKRPTLLIIAIIVMAAHLAAKPKDEARPRVAIETTMGTITVELYNETPLHRDNFIKLVEQHFYDSLLFHRVIDGFMIQAGDPLSKHAKPGERLGEGSLSYDIEAEIDYPDISHKRGALCAAREGDDVNPEFRSSPCQFYIAWGRYRHLDGKYTVYGEVVEGLDVVERIIKVATDKNDRPLDDVRIVRASLLMKNEEREAL